MSAPAELRIFGLDGVPDVQPGMDLLTLILDAVTSSAFTFAPGDVLIVTSKIVSKAEGCLVDLGSITPSALAREYAQAWDKDPRHVEVVLQQSKRIVRMDRGLILSETHHGFVCANAGVDASNVAGAEIVCVLPPDPDASAARIAAALQAHLGYPVPVIISDSFGRAWRNGIINIAIGAAGLDTVIDYRGRYDPYGYLMFASILAVGDELASAAELVMGKVDSRPLAVIRGYAWQPGEAGARPLLMPPERDMFR
jgi:coenzyme F420-0:L-glutamate ligase/coenzyme F420-1:gamma-L-glutamate ligase